MTTTNNYDLIERVGGIERAREIVGGHSSCYMPDVFKYWSNELDDYVLGTKHATTSIDSLRTAIAQHDQLSGNSGRFKVGGSIVKINNGGYSRFETEVHQVELVEHERVKVFSQDKSHSYWVRLELFRHATPAEIKAGRRLDHFENVTDMVTDIRNHISTNTKVVEL